LITPESCDKGNNNATPTRGGREWSLHVRITLYSETGNLTVEGLQVYRLKSRLVTQPPEGRLVEAVEPVVVAYKLLGVRASQGLASSGGPKATRLKVEVEPSIELKAYSLALGVLSTATCYRVINETRLDVREHHRTYFIPYVRGVDFSSLSLGLAMAGLGVVLEVLGVLVYTSSSTRGACRA